MDGQSFKITQGGGQLTRHMFAKKVTVETYDGQCIVVEDAMMDIALKEVVHSIGKVNWPHTYETVHVYSITIALQTERAPTFDRTHRPKAEAT